MKRKALLIEVSGTPGQKGYLEGAAKDVTNFDHYLSSNLGGAWLDEEIRKVRNPTRDELTKEIAALSSYDYTFVTASGHGHHVQGGTLSETMFCCKDDEEIAVSSLNTGAKRCVVVVDCCRNITKLTTFTEQRNQLDFAKAAADVSRQRYRAAFDDLVLAAEEGCSYYFSCSIGQAAQEDQTGGYYSQSLVVAGKKWHSSQTGRFAKLDIFDTHQAASLLVIAKEPQQTPTHQSGRRRTYFPFAIYVP